MTYIHSLLPACHPTKIPVKIVRYLIQLPSMRERQLLSQQHSDSARRQAKRNWHPDRCGFFDRVSQDFGPCAGAGAAAWRICTCCHCILSSNACDPCNLGSTSRVLRVRDLGQRIGSIVYSRSRGYPSTNSHSRLARHNATILSAARRCLSCRIVTRFWRGGVQGRSSLPHLA